MCHYQNFFVLFGCPTSSYKKALFNNIAQIECSIDLGVTLTNVSRSNNF